MYLHICVSPSKHDMSIFILKATEDRWSLVYMLWFSFIENEFETKDHKISTKDKTEP